MIIKLPGIASPPVRQEPSGAALGIYTNLRTPPPQNPARSVLVDTSTGEILTPQPQSTPADSRRHRYTLLDAAAGILHGFDDRPSPAVLPVGPDLPAGRLYLDRSEPVVLSADQLPSKTVHRTTKCHRVTISSTAQIHKSTEHNRAFYAGIMQCGNGWTCPVCAAKLAERKAAELRAAMNQREALGLNFSLLTFTAPHTAADKIGELVPKISDALTRFWRGEAAKRFKGRWGIVGHIRSFEIRHGGNGWHPHFHIILVSEKSLPSTARLGYRPLPIDRQPAEIQWILSRWQACCTRAGLDLPNEYGVDLRDGSAAGDYISKFGADGGQAVTGSGSAVTWDQADEVTKGNIKRGKTGSLSPWDLLRLVADDDTAPSDRGRARALFLDYARATKGVSQLRWSRGLRDIFGLSAQKSDEEIVSEQDESAELLAILQPDEWRFIIKSGSRALVLELAETGGSDAVAFYLYCSLYAGDFDAFYRSFLSRLSSSCVSSPLVPG